VRRYLARRIALAILIVFSVTLMTFVLSRVVPSDPARLAAGPGASPEQVQIVRDRFGLDDPLPVQYADYLQNLAQLDLGRSILTSRSVTDELRDRLPATIELVLVSFAIYVVLGIGLAVIAAGARARWVDRTINVSVIVANAIPVFILAFWLQYVLFFQLGWFPAGDRLGSDTVPPDSVTGLYLIDSLLAGDIGLFFESAYHLALPVAALVLGMIALAVRVTRATLLGEGQKDYVRMLTLKGMPRRDITGRHVLRNALVPVLPLLGIQFGYLISATVLVEAIFGWPGIGSYAFDALVALDYEPVMGFVLISTITFVLVNLVVDLLYPVIDPRIRLWGAPT
jgi:ABC-type dipeptide/oligopeptide/nickel transport system permease component